DLLLQQLPDRTNTARVRRGTALFLNRMRDAMQVERRCFGCSDHGANRDLIGATSELVATMRAARAAHDAGAPQPKQDLFDVVHGQTFARDHVAAGDGSLGRASREMKRADDAVLGQCGAARGWMLGSA